MSDDPKSPDLSDLSGINLAPAWVAEIGKPGAAPAKEYKEFEERPGRGRGRGKPGGQGYGRGGDDRGGGRGRGRDDRGGVRKDDNRGRRDGGARDDRRGGGGGGRDRRDDRRGGGKGGRGRDRDRDSRFGDRPPRQEERPPEGISVSVQPVPSGLESLATWIRSSGRATSVYELAQAMLRLRALYQLQFRRTAENAPKLVRCEADGTLWTTREAAVGHWIQAGAPGDFYAAEKIEVEPPKGNFTAIAICGMSGTLLGPPNHHTYQTNLHRLHRERFSNIPIDRYKSRINVEHGEEIVEKWRSQNSHTTKYRWLKDPALTETEPEPGQEPETKSPEDLECGDSSPLSDPPSDSAEPDTTTPDSVPETAEATAPEEPTPNTSEESTSEETPEAESEDPTPEPEQEPEPETEDTAPVGTFLDSTDDLRRHALTHHAEELFTEVESAVIPGNISGKDLGGPLLTALKVALEPLRKSPAALVPGLCKELEGRGLKIFRWGRSLFANGTRPRHLAEDANLSDGISKIISLVREHPGIGSKRILRTVLTPPKETAAEPKPEPGEPGEAQSLECGDSSPLSQAPTAPETPPSPEPEPEPEPDPSDEGKAQHPDQPPAQSPAPESPDPESPKPDQPKDQTPSPAADSATADQPPAKEKEQSPEEHAAEVAVLRDLRWLVHEGYLIEFTDGKIFLATARPPAHPAKKKQAPKRKRAPRQRRNREGKPPSDKPRATEPKNQPQPEVSPDAPTEKIVRDTDTDPPKIETERVPIPVSPTATNPPAEPEQRAESEAPSPAEPTLENTAASPDPEPAAESESPTPDLSADGSPEAKPDPS